MLDTGKNCYYRMMTRALMDWRKLLYGMAVRFQAILRKERAADTDLPKCFIIVELAESIINDDEAANGCFIMAKALEGSKSA